MSVFWGRWLRFQTVEVKAIGKGGTIDWSVLTVDERATLERLLQKAVLRP